MPLTDVKIRQAKTADKVLKLADSGGLYLEVKPNGAKLWRYRYKIAGRENVFALGAYPSVGLQDARKARDDARELVKRGQHPSHARRADLEAQLGDNANTFEAVAREWIAKKRGGWTPYYLRQVERGMAADVYPMIGRRPLRSLTAGDMLKVINRITDRGAATVAINVRQWCSAVCCYAVATLRADGDPVAALKGAIIRPPVKNAKAMSRAELKTFLSKLRDYGGMRSTTLAIRLMLYTGVRTIEMRRGEWAEVKFDELNGVSFGNPLWVIPGGKMKMKRTHMIPLSRQAVDVLRELNRITGAGRFMFPNSRRPDDIMSATTVNRAFDYMGVEMSAHGFRATVSTHLHEMGYDSDQVETQLAHAKKDKTAAAYNHAQYLAQRREMMQAWADWLDAIEAEALANEAKAQEARPVA